MVHDDALFLQRIWLAMSLVSGLAALCKDPSPGAMINRGRDHWTAASVDLLKKRFDRAIPPRSPISNLVLSLGFRLLTHGAPDGLPICFAAFSPILNKEEYEDFESELRTVMPALQACEHCQRLQKTDAPRPCLRFAGHRFCLGCMKEMRTEYCFAAEAEDEAAEEASVAAAVENDSEVEIQVRPMRFVRRTSC